MCPYIATYKGFNYFLDGGGAAQEQHDNKLMLLLG